MKLKLKTANVEEIREYGAGSSSSSLIDAALLALEESSRPEGVGNAVVIDGLGVLYRVVVTVERREPTPFEQLSLFQEVTK